MKPVRGSASKYALTDGPVSVQQKGCGGEKWSAVTWVNAGILAEEIKKKRIQDGRIIVYFRLRSGFI
jgi:hypothetical protein